MAGPKLTKPEMQIMEALWSNGPLTISDIHKQLSAGKSAAYTTVQTMVNRLETKRALHRIGKSGNAHVFEAIVSRDTAQSRLIDDLLALFGGRMQPILSHLIESGRLTLKDVEEAEAALHQLSKKRSRK